MNELYRLRLRPRSPWRTPWQADTIAGLLCWVCARRMGASVLRQRILDPFLSGQPPFVFSDAFPGELLPLPLIVRLANWPVESRKMVKRARWLAPDAFRRARVGGALSLADLVLASPVSENDRTHNLVGRRTDTTGQEGSLYAQLEYRLDPGNPAVGGADWFSLYVRVRRDAEDLVMDLIQELSHVGFGADVSTGLGAFDFPMGVAELEPVGWLDESASDTRGMVVLSTFQPSTSDPTCGCWESFTKFGKLGPDFGLAEVGVRKHPLVLLRPGACFVGDRRPFLGRAVPMHELLPGGVVATLRQHSIEVVHPAFGLAIPFDVPPYLR